MKAVFLFLFFIIGQGRCSKVSYENFKVHRVIPKNEVQVNILRKLEDAVTYTFWNGISGVNKSVDVMVLPSLEYEFLNFLKDFDHHVWIQNVQDLINTGQIDNYSKTFDWVNYHDLDAIYNWLTWLSQEYPEVSLVNGGVTYENRTILGVRISFKPNNKIIFIEGGIHASEWISPATVTYIVNQLLTNINPEIQSIARSRDWYVFPVINPDGYYYSHTTDRLWHKNRKPYGGCYGADLNRNWGYHWMDGGSTNDPCGFYFAGSSAFSEIESESLSEFISKISSNIEAYISFHSYSQLLLIPFGHAGLEVPPNNNELIRIGNLAVQQLSQRYGTQYIVGNIPETIYIASGSSSDWVLATNRHIRYVYTFELRDQGKYGFLLPPDQIIPTGKETFDGFIALIKNFQKN